MVSMVDGIERGNPMNPIATNEIGTLSPKLRKLYDLLRSQLEAHQAADAQITVDLEEEGRYRLQSVECTSGAYGDVTIRYGDGKGKRPAHQLSFNDEEVQSFRFNAREFSGMDEDGELVKIVFTLDPRAADKAQPARSMKKAVAIAASCDSAVTTTPETKPCLPVHLARVLVFSDGELGARENRPGGWTRQFDGLTVSSEQAQLWEDHRWLLEYLLSEASKLGSLKIKVPAQKVVNALNMRYTKNFVRFGMAALERLRTSVITVTMTDHTGECATLRLIESFEWSQDGSVKVELTPEAAATFPKPKSKQIAEVLAYKSGSRSTWIAGLLSGGAPMKFSRQQLESLDAVGTYPKTGETSEIWRMLTGMPEGPRVSVWDADWFDAPFYKASQRADQASGPRPHKPTFWPHSFPEILEDFQHQRQRMIDHIASGGFVADASQTVAWRKVEDGIEFVAFADSGLVSVPEELQRAVWR
jgi:hypothetical protein